MFIRPSELRYEMRRPEADYLRDKIYELRIGLQGINYRILYFFHENTAAVVSHGIIKEKQVPSGEIDRAVKRVRNLCPTLNDIRIKRNNYHDRLSTYYRWARNTIQPLL